jgi:hypothetical protein
MNDHTPDQPTGGSAPTQAELYEDLQRIGELEDQKTAIQNEVNERTERLKNAIPHLDKSSLLYQMLSATLKPKTAPATKRPAKTVKKTTGKK